MVGNHREMVPISLLQAILFGIVILLDWPLDKFRELNKLYNLNGMYYCISESYFYVDVKVHD